MRPINYDSDEEWDNIKYNYSSEDDSDNNPEESDSEGENTTQQQIRSSGATNKINLKVKQRKTTTENPTTTTEETTPTITPKPTEQAELPLSHHDVKRDITNLQTPTNTRSQMFNLAGERGETKPPKLLKARDEDLWQQWGDDDEQETLFDKKDHIAMKKRHNEEEIKTMINGEEETIFRRENPPLRKRKVHYNEQQKKQYKKTRQGYERLDFEEEAVSLDPKGPAAQRRTDRILNKYKDKLAKGQIPYDDITEGGMENWHKKTSKGQLNKGEKHVPKLPSATSHAKMGIFGFGEMLNQTFADLLQIWKDTALYREVKKGTIDITGGNINYKRNNQRIIHITEDQARYLDELPDYVFDNIMNYTNKNRLYPGMSLYYHDFENYANRWLKETMPKAVEKTKQETIERMKAHHHSMYNKHIQDNKRTIKPDYNNTNEEDIRRALKGENVKYDSDKPSHGEFHRPEITQTHLEAHPDYRPSNTATQ